MSEENCPTIGAMGVTSGTWMITDTNALICVETGRALILGTATPRIRLENTDTGKFYTLWNFKTIAEAEKKFEWLKTILIGEIPTSPLGKIA